jgi:hypothetical protein
MMRRAMALAGGIVVLVLLVLLVKGCRDSAREQAFRDYLRDVSSLVGQSNQESKALFELLAEPGTQSPVQLASSVNGYRGEADKLVDRAKALDHPSELDAAHRYLVQTLEFRRDGIAVVARELPTALGDTNQDEASGRIASGMRDFLASDVIYAKRVVPNLQAPTKKEGLLDDVTITQSTFLSDLGWLSTTTVSDRVDRIRSGTGTGGGTPAPGLHGTGLGSVIVKPGGQTLAPGGAVELTASANLSFDVEVANQGEHDESDVRVKVEISGAGKPIVVQETLDTIAAGETKTVSIPLAAAPPTGRPVTIAVEIAAVPGEKNTDNNKGEFAAVFTG